MHPDRKDHVRAQQEGGHPKSSREASLEIKPAGTLVLTPNLQIYKQIHFCVLTPGLWNFTVANLAD